MCWKSRSMGLAKSFYFLGKIISRSFEKSTIVAKSRTYCQEGWSNLRKRPKYYERESPVHLRKAQYIWEKATH